MTQICALYTNYYYTSVLFWTYPSHFAVFHGLRSFVDSYFMLYILVLTDQKKNIKQTHFLSTVIPFTRGLKVFSASYHTFQLHIFFAINDPST